MIYVYCWSVGASLLIGREQKPKLKEISSHYLSSLSSEEGMNELNLTLKALSLSDRYDIYLHFIDQNQTHDTSTSTCPEGEKLGCL
jgi:hypothetical protein